MVPSLDDRLSFIAVNARRATSRIARLAYAGAGDPVDRPEYAAFSLTAAFDAFLELGGCSDEPAAFDWDGQHQALCRRTTRLLRRRIRTELECDNDVHLRAKGRRHGAANDELAWDAWADAEREDRGRILMDTFGGDGGSRWNGGAGEGCARTPDEKLRVEEQLHQLGATLAGLLSTDELELVTRVYLQGEPQINIAQELATAKGCPVKRAENTVNVRLHRARTRLRTRLGSEWSELVGAR